MTIAGRPRNDGLKLPLWRFRLEIKREIFSALSIVMDFLIEVEKTHSPAVFESTSQTPVRKYLYIIGPAWGSGIGQISFPASLSRSEPQFPAVATEAESKLASPL